MSGYQDFEDRRIKHLEMIQAVISRLGTDSFLVKGWAVAVVGAFLGFGISGNEWGLAITALLPAVVFWGLDAYFLRAERLFRALYDAVRTGTPAVEPFFMSATQPTFAGTAPKSAWRDAIFSLTLKLFYEALIVPAIVVAAILRF